MNIEPPDLSGRGRRRAEHRACLGLGSNVDPAGTSGGRSERLRRAVAVEAVSTAWESPAVGVGRPRLCQRRAAGPHAALEGVADGHAQGDRRLELGRLRNTSTAGRRLTIDIDMRRL